MYTKQEKENVQKVASVFEPYIKQNSWLDLVWSEKIGYIFLAGIREEGFCEFNPVFCISAKNLFWALSTQIAIDALDEWGIEKFLDELEPDEEARVRDKLAPYTTQLPQYDHLVDEMFGA